MVETVAGKMREAGVRPGTVCAFALPTSCEAIIYFYAIVWIAAIAAPIDPSLPDDEFEAAVRKSGAKVLVSPLVDDSDDPLLLKCQKVCENAHILEWHIHRTTNEGVVLETHSRVMGSGAAWSGGAGDFKLDPDEIAAHIASPVGVVPLSHYAICEAAKSFVSTYELAIGMSTMLAPPLHHIHGILILVATFYTGGHIVLPGYGGFDAEKFWEFAKKHDINWLSASPDQILDLHEQVDKGKVSGSQQQLSFVRASGGACIAPEILQKVESSLKTPVFESYGTAETCGLATTNIASHARAGTAGIPVNGLEVAMFDLETRERCPPGTSGEVAICGGHAATCYFDSDEITEAATYITEDDDGEVKHWFSTGDRGLVDADGYVIVHGSSKEMRAVEIEQQAKEVEAAALLKAEEERREVERLEEERVEAERLEAERLEAERIAQEEEEKRLEEEKRMEEERRKEEEELAAKEAAEAEARVEEERKEREFAVFAAEEELKAKEVAEEEQKVKEAEEKKKVEVAARTAALLRAGVDNPEELDEETATAILSRLEAIEANHRQLREDVEGRNADELEEMKKRVAEAEAEAERIKLELTANGKVVDVRMVELEAAVLAAAASAESSASNTREAVKAAREVADAAYGTNHSQPVEVKASTGDQGALTKTVKVPLDDVEKAMKTHPAVHQAKAFGRKDKRFGAEVYCAIEPKRGARVSEAWLKLHAQSVLPAPMVPKKFYYMSKIPDTITRRELSESSLLQDLSEFSGFSEVKHVKGPQWKPKSKRRTGI